MTFPLLLSKMRQLAYPNQFGQDLTRAAMTVTSMSLATCSKESKRPLAFDFKGRAKFPCRLSKTPCLGIS